MAAAAIPFIVGIAASKRLPSGFQAASKRPAPNHTFIQGEMKMAKGQLRGNKETKKPKQPKKPEPVPLGGRMPPPAAGKKK